MVEQRWLRVPDAIKYSGLSRAAIYRLMTEGQIRSASVRNRGRSRGARVIDKTSIDEMFENLSGAGK
jgi:hypothetical protein